MTSHRDPSSPLALLHPSEQRGLTDPSYYAEGTLLPHSDHLYYASRDEADAGASSFIRSLNGTWKFHYAPSPTLIPTGCESPEFDHSSWDDLPVPAHIQLHGYDRPQYVNTQYPWDGNEDVPRDHAPVDFNPVGCYATTFEGGLNGTDRVSIVFHGVESAFSLWLNGRFVGWATDGFTPSEFDLTDLLVPGTNTLVVKVFKWSAQSWIEDQDFFRFSGIFRDVELRLRPRAHVEDLQVLTPVEWGEDDAVRARILLALTVQGEGEARVHCEGVGEAALISAEEAHAAGLLSQVAAASALPEAIPSAPVPTRTLFYALDLDTPHLWSEEDPHLYALHITVAASDGQVCEYVRQPVGVRRFESADGLLLLNGKRLVFRGVNRHEFGPQGRVMDEAAIRADLLAIKAYGLNAVRTSHYPNSSSFYRLCDELGLYVIDEMNLESHGLWDEIRFHDLPLSQATPGDRPQWTHTLLSRARSMLMRDRNHPSILMWSCGNESLGGGNLLAVADYFRSVDGRLVHYEGVHYDPRLPDTTDVTSQMYTSAADIEEHLRTHREKPFILCEFAHTMGNSFGAVDKYMDLARTEPLFHGAFIWDFADQALPARDRFGRAYDAYGGDFGDRPHDGDFSGNGIFYADHTPKPFMQAVQHVYQRLRTRIDENAFTVTNEYLFTSSAAFDCELRLAREGQVIAQTTVATDVAPESTRTYPLPWSLVEKMADASDVPHTGGSGVGDGRGSIGSEYTVTVTWRTRTTSPWAEAGHAVAWDQQVFTLTQAASGEEASTTASSFPQSTTASHPLRVIEGIHNIGVQGEGFALLFSRVSGQLVSFRVEDSQAGPHSPRELLTRPPHANFWHAPTSNERGWGAPAEDGQWLLASRYATLRGGIDGLNVEHGEHSVTVRATFDLATRPTSSCSIDYEVWADGRVEVTQRLTPSTDMGTPPEFGMLFQIPADYSRLRWYGHGPAESYVDRQQGALLDVWESTVSEQFARYIRPQECGSHTQVRWATLSDADGVGIGFSCEGWPVRGRSELDTPVFGMEFSALPWSPFEVENATHPTELPPAHSTWVRPALMRRGVGGDNSWGARTHPEYCLPAGEELIFRFSFWPVTP
ncbi:glycoside hydrolase family 2 TIM barrel-domain containing protein [Schaalia canis]|uniref:Beta-galactosidase n=1 Tax=Schaalia canis TaxID=100469 RepID=A0A3P1SE36_9ACTO|nr:glycoside hydrolase family 2 TIM barrel-domain containing protein [Schaalia canis]RRC95561.1 DUF4981 domain-containing protein [Schaalia canis]